jgi:hypothetical protein
VDRRTPEVVDAALEWLEDPAAGPLAGEVFSAATGIDLDAAHMSLPRDEDQALDHHPEDDLPRPNPMPVLQWWTRHRDGFIDGRRYLAGAPRSPGALLEALRSGAMRRRPAHLLDLALDLPPASRPRLQPGAPAAHQRRALDGWARAMGLPLRSTAG